MKKLLIAFPCAALLAGAAAAADGTLDEGSEYSETTWSTSRIWVHDTVAKDGGVATINAKNFRRTEKGVVTDVFNQNISGLTLSGINFGVFTSTLQGSAITLVGAEPFLSSTGPTGANVTLALKGEGGTLHKTGKGRFTLATPLSNFSAVRIEDGTLATSGARLAEEATPVTLAGGAVLAPAATVALDALSVTGGVARAKVAPGATLTASSLAFDAGGALLLNGAGAVKVTGQADAALSPRPVFIASDATNVAFAAESAESGFTRAADDAAGLLTVDAATTISEATSATAVQVRNRAALTVDSALTVGDGANPGRLLFTRQVANGANETVSGTGEIAFGAQPGLVLRAAPTGGNTFTWNVRTTGSAGVQFASIATNGQSTTTLTFPNAYVAAWTGGTRFTGVSATITNTMFDAAGDIIVDGNDTAGAALTLRGGTYASRFHLAGTGSKTTLSTAQDKTVTLAGDVDITGDVTAYLYGWNENQKFIWAAPITGSGSLTLNANAKDVKSFRFNATNTYAGATTLTGVGYTFVTNGTTLGAGPITVGSACKLYYDGVPGLALTNTLSGAGTLALQGATTATMAGGEIGSLRVMDKSTATLAGDLTVKDVVLDAGGTLQAAAGATPTLTLDVAAGTTNACAGGTVQDGAGTLAFVKTGGGRLDLGGAFAYTGGTRLDAGMLRLVGGLTNGADIAFWLDASRTDTVTTESDGSVSAWRSCGADGTSFGSYTAGEGMDYGLPNAHDAEENRINGLPTVSFSAYGATDGTGKEASRAASRLEANKTTSQRTVFMVCRPRMLSKQKGNSGAWGASWRDMGQRLNTSASWFTDVANGASYNQGQGSVRQNGSTSVSGRNNQPQVVTFIHARDLIGGQYSSFPDFKVQLGGYATWDSADRGWLSFNGDIAEMIAFTRVLSEAEIRAVENYLGQKWLGQTFHTDGLDGVTRTANVLAPTGALEIRAGATLDLNGVDQTVASLSGQGTIVNTGSRAATLTVTGGWAFRGTIGAGVTVRTAGGEAAVAADVFVEKGGALEVTGGTLAVKAFNPSPVTDGLTIWLDASKSETLALDANNAVTGWVSRLPATTRFTWNATKQIWGKFLSAPTNAPTAWLGAKPCVEIPRGGAIWAEKTVSGRTVFVVAHLVNTWSGGYVWGPSGDDRGLRVWAERICLFGRYSLLHGGESAWLNGTRYAYEETGANAAYTDVAKLPFCFAGRMDDTRGTDGMTAQWVLGQYANAGARVYVAEVLAYDRRLSDAEVVRVNDYLMRKWITSGTAWPEENASAFDAEGALGVSGAGTVDLGGADVTVGSLTAAGGTIANVGTLTLDGDLYVPVAADGSVSALTIDGNVAFGASARAVVDDFTKLDRTHRYKALQATGTVTGELSRSNLSAAYSWGPAKGPIWYVLYRAGTFLFLR